MAGWPWPLDGVQAWFEGLWNQVSNAAYYAANSLWNRITSGLDTVKTALSSSAVWLSNRVSEGISGLQTRLSEGWSWLSQVVYEKATWISAQVSAGQVWLWDSITAGLRSVQKWVTDGLTWVQGQISQGISGLRSYMGSSVTWLQSEISRGLAGVRSIIDTRIQGLTLGMPALFMGAITDYVVPLLGSLGGTSLEESPARWIWTPPVGRQMNLVSGWIFEGVHAVFDWIIKHLTYAGEMIVGAMNAVKAAVTPIIEPFLTQIVDKATEALMPGSPPGGYEASMTSFGSQLMGRITEIAPKHHSPLPSLNELLTASAGVVGLGMLTSLGMIGTATFLDMAHPIKQTGIMLVAEGLLSTVNFPEMIGPIIFSNIYAGIIIPLRYRWNEMYTPMVPPIQDLVTMVVREAFMTEMVVEAPEIFSQHVAYHGFSSEWADRYWTMHFVPIALRQAYENLWRGYWDKGRFMYALHIADVHPMWREDLYSVAFRAPTVRELGYGYDTGEYSLEDIVRYRRWGGLSPEDAEKAGRAMVAYRTEAEREALRRESIADYAAGLDDEAQLRANLEGIGGRPEIIDLWVARASYRRERDLLLDLMKASVSQYVKGDIDETQLDQDLIGLGFVAERRGVLVKEAKVRRLRATRIQIIEKKKTITVARVRKARDLGLLGDQEYVSRLIDHNYTPEDARLDLAIEQTPKPVDEEEIERRTRTITSREARARRRWETRLQNVDRSIDITRLQLEDAGITRDESLDVMDAQIEVYDTLIRESIAVFEVVMAEAPEEKKDVLQAKHKEEQEVLMARRLVLFQRRELIEARSIDRIRRLTEQHSALVDQRALVEKQRDEELGEYAEELRLIGGVAA